MNRSLKLSLLCAGIFLSGAVVGGLVVRQFAPHPRPPGALGAFGGGDFGTRFFQKLSSELLLTEAQRAAIEPAVRKAGEELRTLRRDSMRQSTAILEAMDAAVVAQLTPEQRKRFAELKEAQRARMRSMMEERQRRREERGGASVGDP